VIEAAVETGATVGGTDTEGWRYAFNFGSVWEPCRGKLTFVRRRVLRRMRAQPPSAAKAQETPEQGPRSMLSSIASVFRGGSR
jgi:hypothetical protein